VLAIDLNGRVALVTGAARGIGLAIATQLRDCGARVVVNDLHPDATRRAAATLGADALAVPGDVTSEAACEAVVATAVAGAGGLDILVNNAGVGAPLRRTGEQLSEDWQRVMDVNLRGTFLMSRAAIRKFSDARRGSIVNVGSVAGIAPTPASNDYGVSKAAVAMMTRTMAADVGRIGIRVNCVAPGFCEAPMLQEITDSNAGLGEAYRKRIPLRRFGEPAEVGTIVAFLCSDLASYITGAVIPADGGWLANAGP
jgi:NAD(P)-dependent dehydrogenase (short-subunit alcohol dehydrogenase family)